MKPRPWYRVWPEYAALVFGIGWVPFLPRGAILRLSRFMGRMGFRFSKRLRQDAMENLDLVFGDELSLEQKETLLRRCYQHFALLVLDIIWFTRHPHARMKKWVQWDEPSTDILFREEAQILLTAHYGNWETVGQAYAALGQPLMSVAAPLKNPKVDEVFIRMRQKTGQTIIRQQGAARKLMQGLRNGKKLAVLLDQNTRPRDGGVFVDFFDRKVPVSSAPAALAVKTNAPVITVLCVPNDQGVYTVTVHGTLRTDPQAENPVEELTGRMTRSMEKVIRDTPEYWCWMYRRWRLVQKSESLDHYPSYARHIHEGDLRRLPRKSEA
ncbi:MAG: hypothetical protein JJU29_09300 [Verrucomicrobia bacterium]|nr:hypothetical protein [Verrucomicrobiota bacterium]MCH8511733.1 hypothetical protein [Kiritimatiellia bacterium]